MRKKYNKTKLRAALLSLLTIALLAATAAFIGTSAAEAVSDSDLAASSSDISSTDITALEDEIPADLGEPKIVMTTSKAVGEKLSFSLNISTAYVDWGDGNIVQETGTSSYQYSYSGTLVGNTVKIYSTVDITYLNCYYNNLTELDISNNTALTTLDCGINNLTTLDVSKNAALTELKCNENNLIKLDVSKNTNLGYLDCYDNNLTSLDISKNTTLFYLDCSYNNLTSLDISKNTILGEINCSNNKLTSLNTFNDLELTLLSCENNNLTSLDLSDNINLHSLYCDNNNLKAIDATNNVNLYQLSCSNNNLTSLNVKNCIKLEILNCSFNSLAELDLSKNSELPLLVCNNNILRFSTLNISNVPLDFDGNTAFFEPSKLDPQALVSITASIRANTCIDLSSEYGFEGKKYKWGNEWTIEKIEEGFYTTVYKWFDSSDNEVTPTKSENGVFTFGDEFVGKTLYCTMTNALYPDLTLKTTSVEILEADLIVEDNVGVVEDVEPSDGIIIRDKDGNIVDLNGVKLIVGNIETNKKKTVLEAIERYNKEFKADSTDCALYDISLVDGNGAKVYIEDGGRIKIKLKYPDNLGRESEDYTYHLYHQKEDGSIEEIAINCEPNGIWFYADEFSPYALTWSLKQSGGTDVENGPGTGESIALTIVASCLAMLSLAAIGAVVYRKKFARSAK